MKDLVLEFFVLFSRLEFALKEAKFFDNSGNADWTRFSIASAYLLKSVHESEVSEAISYLLTTPPKKQKVISDELIWTDTLPDHKNELDLILLYVRRIRNSLFHGGKFIGGSNEWYPGDNNRNWELIKHATTILTWCRDENPNGISEFFDYADASNI
jgi:hypothetical protein